VKSDLACFYVSMANDYTEYRRSHVTLGVEGTIEMSYIDDNKQLCERVCASLPGRLKQCVSVNGRHLEYFR
jgi:hypothetical protein